MVTLLSTVSIPRSVYTKMTAVLSSGLVPETGVRNRRNVLPYPVYHIAAKNNIRKYSRNSFCNSSQKNPRVPGPKISWGPNQKTIPDAQPGRYEDSVHGRPPVGYEEVSGKLEPLETMSGLETLRFRC